MKRSALFRKFPAQAGFTLIEVSFVGAVLVVLAIFVTQFYLNFTRSVAFQATGESIVSDLILARNNSLSGFKGKDKKWGLHLVNGTTDYYEIFNTPNAYSNPNTDVVTTVELPNGMQFTNPSEGVIRDIIFSHINATTTASSISITYENLARSITVKSSGNVY